MWRLLHQPKRETVSKEYASCTLGTSECRHVLDNADRPCGQVRDLLAPLVTDNDVNIEIAGYAALSLGLVFCGSAEEQCVGVALQASCLLNSVASPYSRSSTVVQSACTGWQGLGALCHGWSAHTMSSQQAGCSFLTLSWFLQALMTRGEPELTTPGAKFLVLGLGLLFFGRQDDADATLEVCCSRSSMSCKCSMHEALIAFVVSTMLMMCCWWSRCTSSAGLTPDPAGKRQIAHLMLMAQRVRMCRWQRRSTNASRSTPRWWWSHWLLRAPVMCCGCSSCCRWRATPSRWRTTPSGRCALHAQSERASHALTRVAHE